ncbi:MAG: hypothetical protein Q9P44_08475 [Anaerolineae bacterium]|nr:hypothetical protein [Anaerolineae bacterium]
MSISLITSFTLTLLIFSYILGDNVLFRLAVSAFVGLTAAFTTIAIVRSVITPLFIWDNLNQNEIGARLFVIIIAGTLALLLLLKPIPALKSLTNLALAFLIAVGTAVALVGATTGTIIPLISDTTALDFDADVWFIINGIIILIGVVTSLLYFRYQARQNLDGAVSNGRIIALLRYIGQGFIVVTLGAIYATAILTSLTVLTGQISVLLSR